MNTYYIPKKLIIISLIVLSTSIFSGCQFWNAENSGNEEEAQKALHPTEETASDQDEPIRIGIHSYPTSLFWYLIEDLGYIEEEKANVQITYYESISDYIDAMSNNELDVIGLAYMDIFTMWQNGYKVKAVVAADYSYGADVIITRKNKDIDNIKDLKGQKIAVETGTVSEFFLDFTLTNRANLNTNEVEKIHYSAPETAQAFLNNEIDVISTFEPYVQIALSSGDGQIIFDSSNERGLIPDVWVVEESKLEKNKEKYKKVFKAWFRAIEFYKQNPDKATEIIAKRAGITKEEFKAQLENLYIMDLRDNITAFSIASGFESLHGSGRLILDFYKSKEVDNGMPEIEETIDSSIAKELSRENI